MTTIYVILCFVWVGLGMQLFIKLNQGFSLEDSLNPFFQKSKTSQLIEHLEYIKDNPEEMAEYEKEHEEEEIRIKGSLIIKNIVSGAKHFYTSKGIFSDTFMGTDETLSFYSLKDYDYDLSMNHLGFLNGDVYGPISLLNYYFEFDVDELIQSDCDSLNFSGIAYVNYNFFLNNIKHQERKITSWWSFWNKPGSLHKSIKNKKFSEIIRLD